MIRRDYILRMIEEFMQALGRIQSLKKGQLWQEASATVEQEMERLISGGSKAVAQLSEMELLARIMQGEPTQAVREKTLMLTTLLKEAGDLAGAQESTEKSDSCYLKGLHLLLHTLAQGDAHEHPEFVPKVEEFLTGLQQSALPLETLALLMQHYERIGEFGKAEDALFAILDRDPKHPGIIDFGIVLYQRLRGQSDAALTAGNLPRAELEAGLAELQDRKARVMEP